MPGMHKMSAEEFARRLQNDSHIQDKSFAFFFGAGCSISSGIPAAGSLVKDYWLPQLQKLRVPDPNDVDKWMKEEFPNYDPECAASSYGSVMERVFLFPDDRQREIERLCDGKFPGFGYAVLAKLITREVGKFNVVITTNFDDLVSDAFYLYTTAHPLVIGHESLAGFIRPTRTRPLVVKLHGDAHLAPQNTAAETSNVKEEVERQVRGLLNDRGLIIIGYGGNDQGIVTMLSALPKEALPFGVYWISGSEPKCLLQSWLEERNAIWVEKLDFDEMMLLIHDSFDLAHPDSHAFDAVFQNYTDTYTKLSARINSDPLKAEDIALLGALERADKKFTDWWSYIVEGEKYEKNQPEKANDIYAEGLRRFPDSTSLISTYAFFLFKTGNDNNKVEQLYKHYLEIDANDSNILSLYAFFLQEIRKDYDGAEKFYLRALDVNPNDVFAICRYGLFFEVIRKNFDEAEKLYLHALELEPNNPFTIKTYASFIQIIKKDSEKAESLFLRAIEVDPNDPYNFVAYADFLLMIHKDYDKVEQLFKQALEHEANDVFILTFYADFLFTQGKNEPGNFYLKRVISQLNNFQMPNLTTEVWFCAFCHGPEEERQEALGKLKKSLLEGNLLTDSDLSDNVDRARKDGHPDISWIGILTDVITKGKDIKELDAWPAWEIA